MQHHIIHTTYNDFYTVIRVNGYKEWMIEPGWEKKPLRAGIYMWPYPEIELWP